jgi:diguanylate cyclase (GGDEF)-like protein
MEARNYMSEIQQNQSFGKILDDTNQLIQISEIDGFSMLYANEPARKFTNHENLPYEGNKCYKYIMGLEEQCPFCPMRQMGDKESYITEIDNGEQVFTVKTKKITWQGKEAFIEYATDITMVKRAQMIFESQMQTLMESIPKAQGIFHVNLTKDQWISSNGVSANITQLQDISTVNDTVEKIARYIPDEIKRKQFFEKFSREALIQTYENGKTETAAEIQSYYDDGSIRWARMTARMIMNPNTGDLESILYGMDISEEKMYQEQMEQAKLEKERVIENSKRDLLTGLYSKKAFEQIARDYVQLYSAYPYAILFTDIDNFKMVNDTLGHLEGDNVIIDVSNKLQTIFSNKDIISRFGGDEFCILIKNIPRNKLIDKLKFMLKKMSATYGEEELKVKVTASIGVVFCEGVDIDIMTLIDEADEQLYQAKRNGKNQYCMKDFVG